MQLRSNLVGCSFLLRNDLLGCYFLLLEGLLGCTLLPLSELHIRQAGTANGYKYVGQFGDDKFSGQMTLTTPDGYKYIGEFQDGHRRQRP